MCFKKCISLIFGEHIFIIYLMNVKDTFADEKVNFDLTDILLK